MAYKEDAMQATVTHIRDLDSLYHRLGVLAASPRPCRAYVAKWAQDEVLAAIDEIGVGGNIACANRLIAHAKAVALWWQ